MHSEGWKSGSSGDPTSLRHLQSWWHRWPHRLEGQADEERTAQGRRLIFILDLLVLTCWQACQHSVLSDTWAWQAHSIFMNMKFLNITKTSAQPPDERKIVPSLGKICALPKKIIFLLIPAKRLPQMSFYSMRNYFTPVLARNSAYFFRSLACLDV